MIAQLDKIYIKTRPAKMLTRLMSYLIFEGRPLTTRGRWINPFVFAHYAIEKRLPQLRKVEKPIFILGTGRSGTTVLGVALSMHRDVGFLNEPKALWSALRNDEDLIGSYSMVPARYRLTQNDADYRVIQNAHKLYGAYLLSTFSRRIVDKYPELVFRVPFVKSIFPDAKFIFLVRNGWDTCISIEQWSERLGANNKNEIHDWWGVDRRKWRLLVEQLIPEHIDLSPYKNEMLSWTKQSDMAAVEWILTMREGIRLKNQYPNDILQVKYEELCTSTSEIMKHICSFAELEYDELFYKYADTTLHPVARKIPFELSPPIKKPFLETMSLFGY